MEKNSLKKLIVLILLVALASGGVLGIMSFLSDGDTKSNSVTIASNKIELVEDFEPPKELKPGISFKKDVRVENKGSNCFVRIKARFTDSDMEKYCTVDYNTTDYEYEESSGFYYLKRVLNEGETAPSLFTTVTLSDSIPEAEIKDFDILIYAESYQQGKFTDYREAWDYFMRNKPTN